MIRNCFEHGISSRPIAPTDFGRVLAGFEVAESDLQPFRAFLEGLGSPYTAESDYPAYRVFLG